MKIIPVGKENHALIDDEDYELVKNYRWCECVKKGTTYAAACINGKMVLLHRLILGVTDPKLEVDHINGIGLNNIRANLRVCTRQQNSFNRGSQKNTSSKYVGVSFNKRTKSWAAAIGFNRKVINLGRYKDEVEAAKAYNEAAKVYHGEFARLNTFK
jgi:hypothetical protein